MDQQIDTGVQPSALLIVLAGLGLADATFLTIEHYRHAVPGCSIFDGCDKVLTSVYAMIGPIPVAVLGLIYYGCIFMLALGFHRYRGQELLRFIVGLTGLGLIVSAWFFYLQLIVIRALCPYCLVSAIISILLFIISAVTLQRLRSRHV